MIPRWYRLLPPSYTTHQLPVICQKGIAARCKACSYLNGIIQGETVARSQCSSPAGDLFSQRHKYRVVSADDTLNKVLDQVEAVPAVGQEEALGKGHRRSDGRKQPLVDAIKDGTDGSEVPLVMLNIIDERRRIQEDPPASFCGFHGLSKAERRSLLSRRVRETHSWASSPSIRSGAMPQMSAHLGRTDLSLVCSAAYSMMRSNSSTERESSYFMRSWRLVAICRLLSAEITPIEYSISVSQASLCAPPLCSYSRISSFACSSCLATASGAVPPIAARRARARWRSRAA